VRNKIRILLVIVVAIIGLGVAPAAQAAAPQPDVLSWSGWTHCYFDALHWVDVRARKDLLSDGRVKNYQMGINGPGETVTRANIWEQRGSTNIYTGGYAGAATHVWTSPVTQLPYMASGANRYAKIQVERDNIFTPVCATSIKIG
jgi:hypothetical protein